VHTAKPVARGLGRRVGHRLLRTAGGSTRFAGARFALPSIADEIISSQRRHRIRVTPRSVRRPNLQLRNTLCSEPSAVRPNRTCVRCGLSVDADAAGEGLARCSVTSC
jgi:hypothetical protein